MHARAPPPTDLADLPPTHRSLPLLSPSRQLARDYADKRPLVIGTLKGAIVFLSDLVRAMEPPPPGLQLDFVRASSYGAATESSGQVRLSVEMGGSDVRGRHVLLVSAGSQGRGGSLPLLHAASRQTTPRNGQHMPVTPPPHTKRRRPASARPPPYSLSLLLGLGAALAGAVPVPGAARGGPPWRVSSASVAQTERGWA